MSVICNNFISVEGTDGSGKSTIAKYIGQYLTEKGIANVVVDSYPRDEDALFKRDLWIQKKVPDIAILAIILELRVRVLKETILPALLEGKVVISDRWHDTTWAYQHYACGVNKYVMNEVFSEMFDMDDMFQYDTPESQEWLTKQILGYSTIFLDVDVETSRKRVSSRPMAKDAFELKDDAFFERVAQGFRLRLRNRNQQKNPLYIVDGRDDLEVVKAHIRSIVDHMPAPQVPVK